jgi:hypothetical protein
LRPRKSAPDVYKQTLSAYGIDFGDVQSSSAGANTLIGVDANSDSASDFQITLLNAGAPAQTDYFFG